jgi:hypothetical protein
MMNQATVHGQFGTIIVGEYSRATTFNLMGSLVAGGESNLTVYDLTVRVQVEAVWQIVRRL